MKVNSAAAVKRFIKRFLPAAGVCLLVMTAGFPAFASEEENRFVEGTTINHVVVSGDTLEEAKVRIESYFQDGYVLEIEDKEGNREEINGKEILYGLKITGSLAEVLEAENAAGRLSGPGFDNSYRVDAEVTYDEEGLKAKLGSLSCVQNAQPTENARISAYEEGKPFTILPEVQGTEIDQNRLLEAAKAALNEQRTLIRLEEEGCYKQITVTSDNAELNQLCGLMNDYKDITITYTFGENRETLTGPDIVQWIAGSDGTELLVDEAKAAAYVKSLADRYDTYGKPHVYQTTSGREVTVTGSYGWQIDQAAETAELISLIKSHQSQTREPVYDKTAVSRDGYDFGNTYIEVDLKEQHLYFYENGTMIIDAPFVSGNVAKDWTTPPGLFTLYYKQTDKVLRGEDYETPVKYWMPFNGGIGLHDANWRGSFGGEIYKTNGSHGCINLPPAKAAQVYEHAYKGIPIICCD